MPVLSASRILDYWKNIHPDHVAVYHGDSGITWSELDSSSNRLARVYAEFGVKKDDLVAIALPNSLPFFEALYAVWKLGATPLPIPSNLPKLELDRILNVAKPSLVIGVEDGVYHAINTVSRNFKAHESISDDPLEECTARYLRAVMSGGSTGFPKLVVMNRPAIIDTKIDWPNYGCEGPVYAPGPLYHSVPFVWTTYTLSKGFSACVATKFDAEETLRTIEKRKIHTVHLVPTMMQRIWLLPGDVKYSYDLSSLSALWHAAAPCPVWLKEAFIDWLGPEKIWELYGSSEGVGLTMIRGDEFLLHKGSVGKPSIGCEMKVVGENGETLPPGQAGEIYMRAKGGSPYFYKNAEPKSIGDGWESFGDVGYMDEEGYLYLGDRLTDMILSGGANIYPAEVEAAIDACPGVRSSVVIGLPYKDMGNAPHAIVDVPDNSLTEEDLLAFLAERLVKYKLPRSVEFVSHPLRNDAGKANRNALREQRLRIGSERG